MPKAKVDSKAADNRFDADRTCDCFGYNTGWCLQNAARLSLVRHTHIWLLSIGKVRLWGTSNTEWIALICVVDVGEPLGAEAGRTCDCFGSDT
ncbi:hypothetical protein L195_g024651, partial [Trifolium pratense]